MVKLGTFVFEKKDLSFEESVKLLAKAGFGYVDFSLSHDYGNTISEEEKEIQRRLKILNDNGIKVSQAHAPYIGYVSKDPNDFTCDSFFERIKKSVGLAAILGAPYIVQHLCVP